MQPFDNLPEESNSINLTQPFPEKHWFIAGVRVDDGLSEYENVMNVINSFGSGKPFAYDHHTVVCYEKNGKYLYFYESGWGPGYALTSVPLLDGYVCETTTSALVLGSGVDIGMSKNELEALIGTRQAGDVYDIRFEQVVTETMSSAKICPLWHSVSLKITFEENKVTAVYFDEHTEPYAACIPIDAESE